MSVTAETEHEVHWTALHVGELEQDPIKIKARFPLPELMAFDTRVDGCQKMHPSWGAVNSGVFFDTRQLGPSTRVSKSAPKFSGRQLGPWTRVVETGL